MVTNLQFPLLKGCALCMKLWHTESDNGFEAPTTRRPKSAFSTNNFSGKLISEGTPKIKQNKRKWNNDESKDMMALMILHWSSSCNRPVTPLPHSHLTSPITSEKQTARAQLNGSNLLFGKNFTPLSKPRP